MRREWFGIDKLRLDKFMMLVRKFLHHLLLHLAGNEWHPKAVKRLMSTFLSKALLGDELGYGIGFELHLADIYIDTLQDVVDMDVPSSVVSALLEPFVQVLAFHSNKAVMNRVQTRVFLEGVVQLSQGRDAASQGLELVSLVSASVREQAEDPEGAKLPKNRRYLYSVLEGLRDGGSLKRGRETEEASVSVGTEGPSKKKKKEQSQVEEYEKISEPKKKMKKDKHDKMMKNFENEDAKEGEGGEVVLPLEEKKKKKKKVKRELEAVEVSTPEKTLVSEAEERGADTAGKEKKKKRKKSSLALTASPGGQQALLNGDSAKTNPGETTPKQSSRKRKSVHFSLKNNLEFVHNGPVHPPAVRTPKGAQPNGPALKVVSKWPSPPMSAPAKRSQPFLANQMEMPATEVKSKKKRTKGGNELRQPQFDSPNISTQNLASPPSTVFSPLGAPGSTPAVKSGKKKKILGNDAQNTPTRSRAIDFF
mmetsp:Transcript_15682/g.21672  ORF Transcript_15682/g.21672 Transcript_15682/m.21672 type:complete len:478 (+) Transcript_15682:3-1436(+)